MSTLNSVVSFRSAMVAISITVGLWLLTLAGIYYLSFKFFEVTITAKNTPMAIQLPKFLPVTSSVNNQLNAKLDHLLPVSVPVDQIINAQLPESIPVDIELETEVQLNTKVNYQAEVPIRAEFNMDVPMPLISVPIPVKLPLAFEVPVNMTVPISETIPVRLKTQVTAQLKETIPAKFKTIFKTKVPINSDISGKVITEAEANLMLPTAPIAMELHHSDMTMAVSDISLVRTSLNYPAPQPPMQVDPKDIVFVYDASKKPPIFLQ